MAKGKPSARPSRAPLIVAAIAVSACSAGAALLLRREPGVNLQSPLAAGPSTGDPKRDFALADAIAALAHRERYRLAVDLLRYERATAQVVEARTIVGRPNAPVRVTYWTDAQGTNSATLHGSLAHLMARYPEDVALDPRHFPDDAACNDTATDVHDPSIRCLAARARICVEANAANAALAYATSLFDVRVARKTGRVGLTTMSALSPEKIFDLGAAFLDRRRLEECVNDAATDATLSEDVALARSLGARKAPFVLVNGRRAAASAHLLTALVLTRGAARHPAFAPLPEVKISDVHEQDREAPRAGP